MRIDYWQTFYEEAYYHVYNRTVGNDLLFLNPDNYSFFLKKYQLYLGKYVDTVAFCLMSNHFHLIIKPKRMDKSFLAFAEQENTILAKQFICCAREFEVSICEESQVSDASKASDTCDSSQIETYISYDDFLVDQFRRFFNSYSAAFNKQQNRTGSLFQRKFKRIQLTSVPRLLNRICYVHHNPIHHDASPFYDSWRYSSYKIYMCKDTTQLARDLGLSLFAAPSNVPKTPESTDKDTVEALILHHTQFHEEWMRDQCRFDANDVESL